jgi:hypothetical protein
MADQSKMPGSSSSPFAAGLTQQPLSDAAFNARWVASGLLIIVVSNVLSVFTIGAGMGYFFSRREGEEIVQRRTQQLQSQQKMIGDYDYGQRPNLQRRTVSQEEQQLEVFLFSLLLAIIGAAGLFGQWRCLYAPPQAEAKKWITASLATGALALGASTFVAIPGIELDREAEQVMNVLSICLGSAAQLCFIAGLTRIVQYMMPGPLYEHATSTLRWTAAGVSCTLLALIVSAIMQAFTQLFSTGTRWGAAHHVALALIGGFGLIALIAAPIWLAKYFNLLTGFRSALIRGEAKVAVN